MVVDKIGGEQVYNHGKIFSHHIPVVLKEFNCINIESKGTVPFHREERILNLIVGDAPKRILNLIVGDGGF